MIPRKFHRRLLKISPKNLSSVVCKIFLTKKLLSLHPSNSVKSLSTYFLNKKISCPLPCQSCQEFERIFFAILSNLRKTRSLLEHKAAPFSFSAFSRASSIVPTCRTRSRADRRPCRRRSNITHSILPKRPAYRSVLFFLSRGCLDRSARIWYNYREEKP